MASNNFKPFGIGNGANVTSQSDYEALAALLTGFQSGKASSAQINKALRQSTVMASILAQFISDSAGVDVLDNGNTTTILGNLKAGVTALTPGRLLSTQVITSSQAVTPPAGANFVDVEAIGGGASGASSATTTSGKTSLGSGGGSGTYGRGIYSVNFQSIQCTIGNGGLPSAVGANDGNPGGSTTFGNLLLCPGGKAGVSHAAGNAPYFTSPAGQGNDATGWNVITVPGKQSVITFTLDGSNIIPSPGADSFFGTGGLAYPTVGNGSGGRAFGSGGGAAISNNGSQGFQGGGGANGVIILRWYA